MMKTIKTGFVFLLFSSLVIGQTVTYHIASLISEGTVLHWSNDALNHVGLDSVSGIEILDTDELIAKSVSCADLICYILSSSETDLDYLFVSENEGQHFQIFDTQSKVMVLEAERDSLATTFSQYLASLSPVVVLETAETDTLAEMEEDVITDSVIVPPPAVEKTWTSYLPDFIKKTDRSTSDKIRLRYFRTLDKFVENPANLGRDHESFTAWNFFPDMNVGFQNDLLTPGWYKEWWTVGEYWSPETKNDYLETIEGKALNMNIVNDFSLGFRIGPAAVNFSTTNSINLTLPADLLGLPMQDITFDDPITNLQIGVESVPAIITGSVAYGQVISTPYGDLKLGLGLNLMKPAGYIKFTSDDFSIELTEDSIFVSATGESWVTKGGADGHLDEPDMDNFDPSEIFGDLAIGIDIGAIMDLQPIINQNVEVQVALRNLGAKFRWEGVSHEAWSFEARMPGAVDIGDSSDQFITEESVLIDDNETYELSVPVVLDLGAYYQPSDVLLIGANLEKAFISEDVLHYDSDFTFSYQLSLYPIPAIDLSYYRDSRFGVPIHTFGTGLHFGLWDGGLKVSLYDGLNSGAKGIGIALASSWYF